MHTLLDHIIWNTLHHDHAALGTSSGSAAVFDVEVGPFAAMPRYDEIHFKALYELIPDHRTISLVTPFGIQIPEGWTILQKDDLFQMICLQNNEPIQEVEPSIVALDDHLIPQMMALTALTKPGPFLSKTKQFGHYHGILDGDRLVAMAGLRFAIEQYKEISAVCTHPDFTGRGYGRSMMRYMMNLIKKSDGIPFLHVRQSNTNAIHLYKKLGFEVRQHMYLHVIRKKG